MENTVIKTSEAFIYVGKHSDTNLYGKTGINGNGFFYTIQVYKENNRTKTHIFVETAEFINEMYKKYGEELNVPKSITEKINRLKNQI
jgi:hypothetical protein